MKVEQAQQIVDKCKSTRDSTARVAQEVARYIATSDAKTKILTLPVELCVKQMSRMVRDVAQLEPESDLEQVARRMRTYSNYSFIAGALMQRFARRDILDPRLKNLCLKFDDLISRDSNQPCIGAVIRQEGNAAKNIPVPDLKTNKGDIFLSHVLLDDFFGNDAACTLIAKRLVSSFHKYLLFNMHAILDSNTYDNMRAYDFEIKFDESGKLIAKLEPQDHGQSKVHVNTGDLQLIMDNAIEIFKGFCQTQLKLDLDKIPSPQKQDLYKENLPLFRFRPIMKSVRDKGIAGNDSYSLFPRSERVKVVPDFSEN